MSMMSSVRLSVCNVGGLGSHKFEILETNCTDNLPNAFALRSPLATHLFPGERGEILGILRVNWVGKSGVLEHKSGNISETRKDK